MKLYLLKENNNFDLLRFILAFMVIYGHAQYLNRGSDTSYTDPLLGIYPHSSSGDIAVKCFFFLSGLLITNSLRKNPSVIYYLISRIFRILPPLIFVLFIITFLFGPLLSTLSVSSYLSAPETWEYFIKGSLLKIQYYLPGVFSTMEHNSVNGSLWTLPIEFRYYLLLLAFFLLTGFKRVWLVNLVLGIVLLESLFGNRLVLNSFGDLSVTNLLPVSFFFGVFLGINSDSITPDIRYVMGLFILFFLFRDQPFGEIIFTFFFCAFAFWLATLKPFFRWRPAIDISYGVYLWGYFVQQSLYYYFGTINIWLHIFLALGISVFLGVITHYVVEKPFMKYGKALSRRIMQPGGQAREQSKKLFRT